MTTITVREGDPEPDRRLVYTDEDGDTWQYGESPAGDPAYPPIRGTEGWYYSRQSNGFVSRHRPWNEVIGLPWEAVVPETAEDGFTVKDSGVREEYDNGFVRDTEDGKPDLTRYLAVPNLHLVPIEMVERLAAHMTKGAQKYGEDNWRKATGPVAVARFLRSLARHVVQYFQGDRTEDHAAAITFNVWAAEVTRDQMGGGG